MICGEVQFEGAFDKGNARVSCTESSISRKKLTPGVMWKAMATIALHLNKYAAFQQMVIVVKVSCCSGYGLYEKNILLYSFWILSGKYSSFQ